MPRTRYRLGLLLMLAVVGGEACDLPTGGHGRTPLTLSFTPLDSIIVGDTTVLNVEARDPDGRLLVHPPLVWAFPGLGSDPPLSILREQSDRATVVGRRSGDVGVQVYISYSDPRFEGDPLNSDIAVRYGPITVRLVGVGRDTMLSALGQELYLAASAVDEHGDHPVGNFLATTQARSVQFIGGGRAGVRLDAIGSGEDTVVVSHSACPNPCGDTVVVNVDVVPAYIAFPHDTFRVASLNLPFQVSATAKNQYGFDTPDPPIVWHLADSSGILSMVDSSSGTFVPHTNGTTAVQATAGDVTDTLPLVVHQLVTRAEIDVAPYVVDVGTQFVAKFRGWDYGGTEIDSLFDVSQTWSTDDPSIATVIDAPGGTNHTASLQSQGYGTTNVDLTLFQCEYTCGDWHTKAAVQVIPDPDSVAVDLPYTSVGAGSDFWIHCTLYLPGEPSIETRWVSWESLDPDVATVDDSAVVHAISPGTARIVGSMGTAADTAFLTVVQ